MPPSHRARWVAFVAEARREDTREKRLAACISDLAAGSGQGASAGYSGTPLVKKLGIKNGSRVGLCEAPDDFPGSLADLPEGVVPETLHRPAGGRVFDVILLFVRERAALARRFGAAAAALKADGGLWVAWPKRSSGVATDLTEDRVRDVALAAGLVDNKVCAIDATWSGLRCVYRRSARPSL
ncbi:MAG: YdeI/OmpD-associated family protein [Candidatus Sericytochromatia bacterium]|nr:YdeI/OmpD-associated family protein [Candidatus Tanganyikabacteria bacterium]